jgi:hypothetical protein
MLTSVFASLKRQGLLAKYRWFQHQHIQIIVFLQKNNLYQNTIGTNNKMKNILIINQVAVIIVVAIILTPP